MRVRTRGVAVAASAVIGLGAGAGVAHATLTMHKGYNLTAVSQRGLPALSDASLAYDNKGGGHLVGISHHHLVYLTHASGGKRWVKRHVGGNLSFTHPTEVTATRSQDGKHILVTIRTCITDDIFTTVVGAKAHRLPAPQRALERGTFLCHGDDQGVSFMDASLLPGGQAVLVFNELNRDNLPGDAVTASVGTPGETFSDPVPLPDPDSSRYIAIGLTYVAPLHQLTVIADNPDTHGLVQWTRSSDGTWSDPTVVTSGSESTPRFVAGTVAPVVVSWHKRVYVGMTLVNSLTDQRMALVTRASDGTWSSPAVVAGFRKSLGQPYLAVDARNGHLHLAFQQYDKAGNHRELAVSVRSHARWSKQVVLTKGRYDADTVEQMLVTPGGNTAIGFRAIS
jgi:hypothetical protein